MSFSTFPTGINSSVIESVQRGVAEFDVTADTEKTTDVTITAVDTSNCMVLLDPSIDEAETDVGNFGAVGHTSSLTGSTTLRITSSNPNGYTFSAKVGWQVIEFATGFTLAGGSGGGGVESVQSGAQTGVSITTTKSDTDVTVSSVNTSKCVVIVENPLHGSSTQTTSAYGEMTSATNLRLTHQAGATVNNCTIHWRIVEYA